MDRYQTVLIKSSGTLTKAHRDKRIKYGETCLLLLHYDTTPNGLFKVLKDLYLKSTLIKGVIVVKMSR